MAADFDCRSKKQGGREETNRRVGGGWGGNGQSACCVSGRFRGSRRIFETVGEGYQTFEIQGGAAICLRVRICDKSRTSAPSNRR